MSEFLRVLNHKYEGDFSSDPYNFGFELDDFQKHAITAIKNNQNVLVTAHTGSGKTVPAIFGIADSLDKNRKIIPIDCSELIWGFGAIHCLTQQEPK